MKLKTKLALMSIGVSSLMCVAITFSAVNSMENVTQALTIVPAFDTQQTLNSVSLESIQAQPLPEPYEKELLTATIVATKAYNSERVHVMAGIIIGGAVLTWLLAGYMLRPLEKLTTDVKAVKPDTLGEISNVPQTRDEVGRLGEAFNEMSQQISEAFNMQKSFSSSAAHELRTPLAVLASEIDVFKLQKNHTENEYLEFVSAIRHSTDRLSGIVEDLLSFTNPNTPNVLSQISILPMILEIADDLETIAQKKEISILVQGENIVINADDALMQRAFYNLIENAVKYSDEHTEVVVKISQSGVSICDNGCGVPDAEKPFIFEPFYRVDKSRSRAAGGSGLGLAIVKQIINKHGFSIAVTSNIPSGTIFTIGF